MSTSMHSSGHDERRRSPRVDVSAHVTGRVVEDAQDVVVRDLSLGGFQIESHSAFAVNAIHHFRIAMKNGDWTTILTAKSVHCLEREAADGHSTFLTGFAFVEPQGADARERIKQLINRATSVVRF